MSGASHEANSAALDELRRQCGLLIAQAKSSGGEVAARYNALLTQFLAQGGPKDDAVVLIGESLYDFWVEGGRNDRSRQGPHEDEPIDGSVEVPFDFLEAFMKDTFVALGVPEREAAISAGVLIDADKKGIDSHGVGRLKSIYADRILKGIMHPYKPILIVKETETTALLDGQMGLGLYIGRHCMELAIQKAKKHGVGFVAVKNSTHYGIAGYYSQMAVDAGCVGFTGTNARPSISPTFGVKPCLGTNPLCFGIPTDEAFPFNIDCATSINQRGKIEKYARLGMPTPKGMVIDVDGKERTDTDGILVDMVKGLASLAPVGGVGDAMGGYKGYGWAVTVELLSTAVQGGPIGDDLCGVDRATGKPAPMPLGHYFLAIDVEALVDLGTFKANAGKLLRYLRETPKDPRGPGRIWTAGEFEHDVRVKRGAAGGTIVPPVLLNEMRELRDKLPGLKEKYARMVFE